MPEPEPNAALVEFLTQRGYSQTEVDKILVRLAVHDQKMTSDSIFDSIGQGSLSLDDIIREALEE